MKKVIELIRVSTERQAADDRASIPAQHAVNQRTCKQYGLDIVRTIEMADVSGASVLLAPEIRELVELMKSPDIDGVVAREFSRLMRPENFADYALLQAFVDSRSILYLPEGPIDLNSKSGRLMGTIRAAIAGLERTEILERVWSAKEEKRRRGELAQSPIVLPFGVGYEPHRGFFYKPEAECVREAFRSFLGGNQSYAKLAQTVGVSPRGMHLILRNPIWTGWRVIDKKRDTSSAGKYDGVDGRQADRRKVDRAPEEVIRVRVIDEPLVSQADFDAVQHIMDLKEKKHWRSRADYEHRFTYNGFLTCSACGEVVHTALARRDYYACKGRRVSHTCRSRYMDRVRLEGVLDGLFAQRLTDRCFLSNCVAALQEARTRESSTLDAHRLTAEIGALQRKRARVIDGFVEGVILRDDRNQRLAAIDEAMASAKGKLAQEIVEPPPDTARMVEAFAPLAEWEYWTRDQKRLVLATLIPDIRVADYEVDSLGLSPALFSNKDTHTGMGSWRRRA
ncbi:MAG TPA: recombinase family protein [Terracidiphilus sp.]|nr:recombinase family protein [Terracidiphilus sp.]